jgi:two-component system cell cycle response regulator DivK
MKRRALLIEDNENNRYLLALLLQHAGYEVMQAENGKLGIEIARTGRPDIILLDIQMPEMDGYEVVTVLKHDPDVAAIPVIGVSSFAMQGDRERALKSGFSGYIEKPVDPELFASEITALTIRSVHSI